MTLRIVATDLPGRTCGDYHEVRVALVGGPDDACGVVDGDAPGAEWTTRLELRDTPDGLRFRGPAVRGTPVDRFVYLTWSGRLGGAPAAMFRRAKLRLDVIPPEIAAAAAASGELVGRVGLTDRLGMPLCASVKPPIIRWSAA